MQRIDAATARAHLDDLAALLKDAVDEGAGVGFVAPLTHAEARAYWEGALPDVASGQRALLVARMDRRVVGTTVLDRARAANGRHRAEVQKVLVARAHRGRGIAARLLAEAERVARAEGVTLLVLDTGRAGGLYERAGYARVGAIPRFWRTNEGSLAETIVFYKLLE